VYARVSSAGQKGGLDRQVARVTAWATDQQIRIDNVVEIGSALIGRRGKFLTVLRDPSVHRIVVEHPDRFCRFGSAENRAKRALAAAVLIQERGAP
jgi:predicted site-specific integrase-resolvase